MTYQLTFQSALHDAPVVRQFENREEADEAIRELNEWFFNEKEEKGIYWRIEPKLEVRQ